MDDSKSSQAFRELGAVGTYEPCVIPVLLGEGIPMFQGHHILSWLRLTEQRTFPDEVVRLV